VKPGVSRNKGKGRGRHESSPKVGADLLGKPEGASKRGGETIRLTSKGKRGVGCRGAKGANSETIWPYIRYQTYCRCEKGCFTKTQKNGRAEDRTWRRKIAEGVQEKTTTQRGWRCNTEGGMSEKEIPRNRAKFRGT